MEDSKKQNNSLEVEGKTVEEAAKKAVELLKVPRTRLKIRVVSEEQRGLFGMRGAKPAKIIATIISQPQPHKKP